MICGEESGGKRESWRLHNVAVIWVVITADGVAVHWLGVPGELPTSAYVAVALADADDNGGDEGQLADVQVDPRPELLATAREGVLKVGLEPARQRAAWRRTERRTEKRASAGETTSTGPVVGNDPERVSPTAGGGGGSVAAGASG